MNLTDYQKAQLLTLHLSGDFKYKNKAGNKVSRSAWIKMIDALLNGGYIDRQLKVTVFGREFLDGNHLNINLSVLD